MDGKTSPLTVLGTLSPDFMYGFTPLAFDTYAPPTRQWDSSMGSTEYSHLVADKPDLT
jgi:hypothetical protein